MNKNERLDEIDVVRIDKKAGRLHVLGKTKDSFSSQEYQYIICSLETGDIFEEEKWKEGFFTGNSRGYWENIYSLWDQNLSEIVDSIDPQIKKMLVDFCKKYDAQGPRCPEAIIHKIRKLDGAEK